MKKLNYNIQEAISLRVLTLDQAGYIHPLNDNRKIDFRLSLSITRDENQWGNIPTHIQVLGNYIGYNIEEYRKNITKFDWKRAYRDYRNYCKHSNF